MHDSGAGRPDPVAASGVILVALHCVPTGLDPIRYAVSDYGWTRYHLGYRAMVVLQGAGAILIAVGLGRQTNAASLGWLYAYGVVRLLVSLFMTDREPQGLRSLTRTGRIHVLLAGTAFASIAVAASHIDWTGRPDALRPLGGLATAPQLRPQRPSSSVGFGGSHSDSSSGCTTSPRSLGSSWSLPRSSSSGSVRNTGQDEMPPLPAQACYMQFG